MDYIREEDTKNPDEQVYFDSVGPLLDSGRYWCKKCQHGTDANDEGYCVECRSKNRLTRLTAKKEDRVEVKTEIVKEIPKVDDTNEREEERIERPKPKTKKSTKRKSKRVERPIEKDEVKDGEDQGTN